MDTIEHQIMVAEQRWPGSRFERKSRTSQEADGPCPFCGGTDRFVIFANGGYWCRQCEAKGWLDEGETLTAEELRLRKIEATQRRLDHQQQEMARQMSALQRMHECTDHLRYHKKLSWDAIEYWRSEGMTNETIDRYQLGYCHSCRTDLEQRPSYTIPVFGRDGKTLINIRHRLVDADGGDKYRPHIRGLGAQLFNAKYTNGHGDDSSQIIITEGEKKSIILGQAGFANVGIMGKRSFKREWLDWLKPFRTVYIALDPDADDSAHALGALLKGQARVARLPCKIDDMIVRYGASASDLQWFLKLARPVKGRVR